MKTNIFSFIIIVFMTGTVLTSCGETSKQDAKAVKQDTKELSKDLKQGAKDTSKEIKTTVSSDWQKFKTESETTIENSEKEIKVLREKIAKASKTEKEKLTKQLDKLEQKNNELKEKLAKRGKEFKDGVISFNEASIANEQKFEREFTHDMNELGTALKDLFKNNVDKLKSYNYGNYNFKFSTICSKKLVDIAFNRYSIHYCWSMGVSNTISKLCFFKYRF